MWNFVYDSSMEEQTDFEIKFLPSFQEMRYGLMLNFGHVCESHVSDRFERVVTHFANQRFK